MSRGPAWLSVAILATLAGCHLMFPFSSGSSAQDAQAGAADHAVSSVDAPPVVETSSLAADGPEQNLSGAEGDASRDAAPRDSAPPQRDGPPGETGAAPADGSPLLPDGPSSCLKKEAQFSSAVPCPVFYTCCAECVDTSGVWRIECTNVDCVCSLNGKNLALCGTTSCKAAERKNCCSK